jgi:hypothetical protein
MTPNWPLTAARIETISRIRLVLVRTARGQVLNCNVVISSSVDSGVDALDVSMQDLTCRSRKLISDIRVVSASEFGCDNRLHALSVSDARLEDVEFVVCLKDRRSMRVIRAFFDLLENFTPA